MINRCIVCSKDSSFIPTPVALSSAFYIHTSNPTSFYFDRNHGLFLFCAPMSCLQHCGSYGTDDSGLELQRIAKAL